MEICLVGDFSDNLDEGYKNTGHYLANHLEKHHSVVRLNAKRVGAAQFWRSFVKARPQIIHTIAQPTDQSLILTRLLRQFRPQSRTVISALRAERYFVNGKISLKQRWLLNAMRPDLVLAQTREAEALFKTSGCPVAQLPNGVDLERFRPVDPDGKRALRLKYGIDLDRPVVLHVGHLEEERNLMALQALLSKGIQIVVAGSLYMGLHLELIQRLEEAGFHLFKGYQPHIEEFYRLADCYVFPTQPGNSLSMPLSVLEAMACNLPVITRRFQGLEQAFAPGNGLTFIDRADDISACVESALDSAAASHTREMAQSFSWQAVTSQLQGYYDRLAAA
jgi:glycosyltransferase involved in cell wall biosynthesis